MLYKISATQQKNSITRKLILPLGKPVISFVQAVGPLQMADAADPPGPRRGRIRAWHEPQGRARSRRPLDAIWR